MEEESEVQLHTYKDPLTIANSQQCSSIKNAGKAAVVTVVVIIADSAEVCVI